MTERPPMRPTKLTRKERRMIEMLCRMTRAARMNITTDESAESLVSVSIRCRVRRSPSLES